MFYVIIVSFLSGFYAAVLLWIFAGMNRISLPHSTKRPFVSVVVAARNEEENMATLLKSLLAQDYPHHRYEIIIVNDQSTDRTAEVVKKFSDARIRLLMTENRDRVPSPKKNAVNLGIRRAEGEIILLTDADCAPPKGWISGVVSLFTPEVGMVIGFSPCELPRLHFPAGHLLALESLSLAAVAAGTAGWGYPATCNGRNLAYRKSVYEQVGGFDKIRHFVSGDDDLMLKLVQQTEWRIQYAYDPSLVVPTALVKSPKQFINQRLRHASKGFHYEPKKVTGLIVVYLYNLLVFLSLPLALLSLVSLWTAMAIIGVKAFFEFLVLFRFASKMQRRRYLWAFPPAELLHVPYVVIFGALGPFKKFKWKNEKTGLHSFLR